MAVAKEWVWVATAAAAEVRVIEDVTVCPSVLYGSSTCIRQPYKSRKRASIPSRIRRYTKKLVPGGRALARGICDPKRKYSRSVSMTKLNYLVTKIEHRSQKGALIDRGANGCVAGQDIRIITKSEWLVNIMGIDNHEMKNIPIGTVGGVVTSQHGEVIAIMHQYAIAGRVGLSTPVHNSSTTRTGSTINQSR